MNTVLVVAKAPVPGLVKTRLTTEYSSLDAARLAAAALLDTLDAALSVPGARCVVALAGALDHAVRAAEVRASLRRCTVVGQSGAGLAARLVHAHRAAAGEGPVLQIGMDTPQVTGALLADGLARARRCAVLGPAVDGGWWALGVPEGAAGRLDCLLGVPMSTSGTGAATRRALASAGLAPADLPLLRDVDHPPDVPVVSAACAPGSRFRDAAERARPAAGSVR